MIGLLLAFTIGVPLHKHYCGATLFSAGIVERDCCCEDTADEPDDCCSSESSYFNIDQDFDQTGIQKIKITAPYTATIAKDFDFISSFDVQAPVAEPLVKSDRTDKVPIYKMVNAFIVYG